MYEFENLNPTRLIEEVKVRPALYNVFLPADREQKLALWKQVGAALFEDWESYTKAKAYDRELRIRLIEEVKVRPALYNVFLPADREQKLALWKQVGAALFEDWESYTKAKAYDRVLQLQKKWRSLRDAYNRELRARKTGVRINNRVYMHFKRMSFLGGFEGELSDEDEVEEDDPPPVKIKKTRVNKRKAKESSSDEGPAEEFEMPIPVYPIETGEDSDKLFLLSFLPEIRQLPPKIKMWARAQIARIMQEAVASQYGEPGVSTEPDMKLIRRDNDE